MSASHGTLTDRVRAIAAELATGADEGDALRRLPDAMWRSLMDSGAPRSLQPKRWGGGEVHIIEFTDAVMEASRAYGSAGWVVGIIGVHPWHLALFDERAQTEMWGDDPTRMHSSSYAPVGKATPAPGGYRLSGRWSFSSGSDHCRGVNLGAIPGMREVGPMTVPDFRSFLLHEDQYRIVDNWHTAGVKGTGSKDIVVDDVFVPEYRTQSHVDYFFDLPVPGHELNDGPLYRLPWSVVFNYALAASVFGTARGFIDTWTAQAAKRVTVTRENVRDDALMQLRLSAATYDLDAAVAVMRSDLNEAWSAAEAREPVPREQRASMRFHANQGCAKVGQAVAELFHAASGRSIFSDHALQRGFQDVQGMLGHAFLVADNFARALGAMRMGGQPVEAML